MSLAEHQRAALSMRYRSRPNACLWSNTVITTVGKGILVIANLNTKQSRMSKLWSGPKDKVIIGHSCIEQNRQHILEAINRLSPYPVEYIGMWRAAMV